MASRPVHPKLQPIDVNVCPKLLRIGLDCWLVRLQSGTEHCTLVILLQTINVLWYKLLNNSLN